MDNIQMVDLKSQYQKIKGEVDSAMQAVIDDSAFIKGNAVRDFEHNLAQYLKVKNVIACGNGTDALQIALMALELKPGDEIITPSFTFIATAEVIALLGLKPVFVDVNPETFTLEPEALVEAITSRTRVIIPVHLFGQCADMNSIMEIAKRHNLYVVEDNAQAIGADYYCEGKETKAGTIGNIGCTSFFPSKNLGAFGDGGAMFTNDDCLAEKIRMIINHGSKRKYFHEILGVNSRLDTLQAAVLNVKLKYLDTYVLARQTAAEYYTKAFEALDQVQTPVKNNNTTHVYHQYTLLFPTCEMRDFVREYLAIYNVPSMIYYPVPLHKQHAFEVFSKNIELLNSEKLSKRVLSLPMHTELTTGQLRYISDKVCCAVLAFV